MVKDTPPLSDAHRALLLHVARYRITVDDALHRLFYRDMTRDAARKALDRLKQNGYLQITTVRNRNFYQLTSQATALLGLSKSLAGRLGAQALIDHFAMLAFCCLGEDLRRRLTPAEFREAFPQFADASGISPAHQHYYFDRVADRSYLARAAVDFGGELSTLKRKCLTIAKDAAHTPVLCDLVAQGCFMVTVLTAEESKAVAIADALDKEETNVRYRVTRVPELALVL